MSSDFDPDINIEVKFTRGQRPTESCTQALCFAMFAWRSSSVLPSSLQVCITWSGDSVWLYRAESISGGWTWVGFSAWGLDFRLIEIEKRFSFYFIGLWTSLRLSGLNSFAQQRLWMLFQYMNWSCWFRRAATYSQVVFLQEIKLFELLEGETSFMCSK